MSIKKRLYFITLCVTILLWPLLKSKAAYNERYKDHYKGNEDLFDGAREQILTDCGRLFEQDLVREGSPCLKDSIIYELASRGVLEESEADENGTCYNPPRDSSK